MLSFNWNNTGMTVELGELVDSGVDIWAFEYPVPAQTVTYNGKTAPVPFDKKAFEQKIIDHYRFRQIGQETVGRWLHYFRTRIREIMPYYVQLYEFEAKWRNVDDPLESYNLKEEYSEERSGSGTVTGKTTDSNSTTSTGNATVSGTNSDNSKVTGTNSDNSKVTGTTTDNTTVDTTSTGTATVNGVNSNTVEREASGTDAKNATQENTRKFSNTPQGAISNLDSYLTEVTVDDGTASENITKTETGKETANGTNEQTTESTGTNEQTTESTGTSEQTSESTGTNEQTTESTGTSEQTSESSGTVTGSGSGTSEQTSEDTGMVTSTLTRRGNIGVQPLGTEVKNIREAFINIDLMVINELKDLFIQVY